MSSKGIEIYGRVVGVRGLMVEVAGPLHTMSVGARVVIETPGKAIPCEVVGFSSVNALLMPFALLQGVLLRRRQIGASFDAGAQCDGLHHGDRAHRWFRPPTGRR